MIEKIREIANKTAMTEAEVAGTLHSQAENGLPLNLQFFAEDSTDEDNQIDDKQDDDEHDDNQDKTFTQSEVDSQISKAVDKALKNQQSKLEEQMQEKIEQERNEAAEYAKLTQKEKEEADYNKRLEALEKREKELNDRQLLNQIESDLKENSLPTSFAQSLLTIQDNGKIKDAITNIKEEFDSAVNEQVNSRLRQDTPSEGTKATESDPFAKIMSKYK